MRRHIWIALALAMASPSLVAAHVCDYRASEFIGESGATAVGAGSASVAAAGVGGQAAGFYTLVHASSGLTMLGSTAGGVSGAGTVGIMGGTGGALGGTAAFFMNPWTIGAAVAAGLGVGGLEIGCTYLYDERITDYVGVLNVMKKLSAQADPNVFSLHGVDSQENGFVRMVGEDGGTVEYQIRNRYVADGYLMHRDWFRNTTVGIIRFMFPIAVKTEGLEEKQ